MDSQHKGLEMQKVCGKDIDNQNSTIIHLTFPQQVVSAWCQEVTSVNLRYMTDGGAWFRIEYCGKLILTHCPLEVGGGGASVDRTEDFAMKFCTCHNSIAKYRVSSILSCMRISWGLSYTFSILTLSKFTSCNKMIQEPIQFRPHSLLSHN